MIPEEKVDEVKFNTQDIFTIWSACLFDAISATEYVSSCFPYITSLPFSPPNISFRVYKSSRELVTKNKILGFQNFDFNVLQVPFKLTFTGARLPKEPREYVEKSEKKQNINFSNSHFQNKIVIAKVVANELVNSEPTNQIYSIDLECPPGSVDFHAGDNALVMASNPVSLPPL
jgi:hypothetical protein